MAPPSSAKVENGAARRIDRPCFDSSNAFTREDLLRREVLFLSSAAKSVLPSSGRRVSALEVLEPRSHPLPGRAMLPSLVMIDHFLPDPQAVRRQALALD